MVVAQLDCQRLAPTVHLRNAVERDALDALPLASDHDILATANAEPTLAASEA